MELVNNNQIVLATNHQSKKVSSEKPFIMANTEESSLIDVKAHHIIPVYTKDNEPLISHYDFIDATWDVAAHVYGEDNLATPSVRVSHPIKGRIPEARNKPALELLPHEKTLYYERMAFIIEVPGNYDEVDGNLLSLTIGGVKAYNLDNLSNKKGSIEHFKVFVGFKNSVCTNLCVSTDGLIADLRVNNALDLRNQIYELLCRYNAVDHLKRMAALPEHHLSEQQFAHLLGRCRMYQYLPADLKKEIPELHFGESQINQVCRDYYRDDSFCRNNSGDINLWKLYNLFTGANKSSYIDNFLERGVNAEHFIYNIKGALEGHSNNWFLN
jgi:hypothetical protein